MNNHPLALNQLRLFLRLFLFVSLVIALIATGLVSPDGTAQAATTGIGNVPYVADNFNNNTGGNTGLTGNDGMVNWSADWTEIGDDGNAGAGDVRVLSAERAYLSILRASNGASRTADLSSIASAGSVTLVVEYRIAQALEVNESISIDVDSGSGWQNLDSISGAASANYAFKTINIKAHAAAGTQIRFLSSSNMTDTDVVYIRYVAVMYTDVLENYCYLVADGHDAASGDNNDLLSIVLKSTGKEAPIGSDTNTLNVEAAVFQPGTTTLYAANAGQFGSINLTTGVFTNIGGGIGTGRGSAGNINLNDIDSLSFDPFSGVLYGAHRRSSADDLLLQINPATGALVPDAFGTGVDYLVIPSAGNSNWADIDDINISSYDGTIFAVANANGNNDEYVKIDKNTGAITAVGALGVNDMEGLAYDVQGYPFGTTGTSSTMPNSLFDINPVTGAASNRRQLTAGYDYEAADCLTWGTNDISGKVFRDLDWDGSLDVDDSGTAGVTVRLYRDVNADGLIDGGDILLATKDTDSGGNYAFGLTGGVAALGSFVLDIDTGDLPTNYVLTTDNLETASFTTVGNTDANNDFGYGRSLSLGGTLWHDDNPDRVYGSGDTTLSGKTVRLYDSSGASLLGTTVTDAGGFYRFDNLPAGDYVVGVPSPGYSYSVDGGPDPDNDLDNDDNGLSVGGGEVRSLPVTLQPLDGSLNGFEPDTPVDGDNNRSNLTIDFGFSTAPTAVKLQEFTARSMETDASLLIFLAVLTGVLGYVALSWKSLSLAVALRLARRERSDHATTTTKE